MERVRLSPVRRFTLWWMHPGARYVSSSLAIDFGNAAAYLDGLRARGHRVTVQHLVCAIVGRLYTEFPVANRRIVRSRVYQAPTVGIAAPVNLVGHHGEQHTGETAMMLLDAVDEMTLLDVARASTRTVDRERAGQVTHPFVASALAALRNAPGPVFRSGLRGIARVTESRLSARLSWRLAPITTAVTNVGATTQSRAGVWMRGAAYEPPHRMLHVGSLWGLGPVQEEVVPVDGIPRVRPVLPVVLVFDHRLFDGVIASRILVRFAEMLRDPEAIFGHDGLDRG